MHELALAEAIVAVAAEHAGGRRVAKVEVRVGALRQVAPGALSFAFQLAAEGTPVEGAELEIEEVPARIACRRCAARSRARELPLACARCGSRDVDVVGGEELLVEALELGCDNEAGFGRSGSRSRQRGGAG
jgi:hydrogenase nickel incorporation protein HypA/HybF